MAYFLKQSKLKKGLYLQIYESFYSSEKKDTAHRCNKTLGYADDLIRAGIADPVTYYSEIVNQMNAEAALEKQKEKEQQIAGSPERHAGYFLLKAVLSGLNVSGYLDFLQIERKFQFRINELIEALVFCRVTHPCSKLKTFEDVMPLLCDHYDISYGQILDGLKFIGGEYEKIIEIFNHQFIRKYPLDTSRTYFDCTNFYFEIDKEDDFRRNGPSKENRRAPIVGMGLLLDAHQIPVGMKLFAGNESEKPVIRDIIQDMKNRSMITGRTVQVADKGLNCSNNILAARESGDGYLFSKSVKRLPATEKTWLLLKTGWQEVRDKDKKLLYYLKECTDQFPYTYTYESGEEDIVMLTEKRVATFNPDLAKKKRYEILKMVEKAKTLKASQAKKQEFGECSKYVTFTPTDKKGKATGGKVAVALNRKAIEEDLKIAGYNLFVTSELQMKAREVYNTYHNLWRIEETFRFMKSYLDARPAHVQKTDSICGHFLICYLCVLLTRLLQFYVLENRYCTEKLTGFMKNFRLVQVQNNKYINITPTSETIKGLARELSLPITNYFLNDSQLKKVLALKF